MKKSGLATVFALATGMMVGLSAGYMAGVATRAASSPLNVDEVTVKDTYDLRRSFPDAPPADVTGFEATFTGHAAGQRSTATVVRTIQVPCNVFLSRGVEENVSNITSAFGLTLSPQAKSQTEDVFLGAKNGVCAPALSR